MTIVSPVPNTLQNGQTADAPQVMANFNSIVADVNAGAAASGANSDITALLGLSTPISYLLGGTQVWIGGTVTGTANAIVLAAPTPAAGFTLVKGFIVTWLPTASNSAATTLNVFSTGVTNVFKSTPAGPAACTGGEIVNALMAAAIYDGTRFVLLTDALKLLGLLTNLASATTTDLGTITTHNVNITGTVTITGFGSTASTTYPIYLIKFAGALTLTHDATALIIPGGQSIVTSAGDTAVVEYLGSGNWKVRYYNYLSPPWVPSPQGRLTLTTAVPVQLSDVAGATSVYYTPYVGNQIPIWNGITFTPTVFSELTLALSNPNHAINSNYDVYIAFNAGVLTVCTGPAWTSDTGRGAGAGTTQLSRVLGLWTNTVSMTARNGATTFTVAAGFGTYVGTIRTIGSAGQTSWVANPAAAAGGGNCLLYQWNAFNRVPMSAASLDSTNTWAYSTTTWRSADNNAANRISAVFGLNEEAVTVTYNSFMALSGSTAATGVGLDVTNAYTGTPASGASASTPAGSSSQVAWYIGVPGLGLHFFQAVENAIAGTTTFHGDNGAPLNEQMALTFQGRM